jgi:hypothetical protein
LASRHQLRWCARILAPRHSTRERGLDERRDQVNQFVVPVSVDIDDIDDLEATREVEGEDRVRAGHGAADGSDLQVVQIHGGELGVGCRLDHGYAESGGRGDEVRSLKQRCSDRRRQQADQRRGVELWDDRGR